MAKRLALPALVSSMLLIAAAYGAALLPGDTPSWSPALLAVGTAGALVAMMAMGAARGGRIGILALPFAFVFVVVAGGFLLVLVLPPAAAGDPELWLGLPPRAAIVLFGIGLVPLLGMPLVYALTFDAMTLSEADLARVREQARALRGATPSLGGNPPYASVLPADEVH